MSGLTKFVIACIVLTIIYNVYYFTMGAGKSASSSSGSSSGSSGPVMSSTGGGVMAAPAVPVMPVAPVVPVMPVAPVVPPAPVGPVYKGCYVDSNNNRVLSTGPPNSMTTAQCYAAAKAAGTNVFGMQYWEQAGNTIGNMAQCWYSPGVLNPNYAAQGTVNKCDIGTDGNYLGEGDANAIYQF